tara:strand:- start:287 stop:541 length:255 start_codon:yes stop_codon:yes gene_type:complete
MFLVFLFLLNITFYFISEDYQFFLKKLKNSEEIVKVNEIQVSDDVIIQSQTSSDIAVVDITPKETSISQQQEISVDQIEVEEIL